MPSYAGITTRAVSVRGQEHRDEGKRRNIRSVVDHGSFQNGADANRWERSMGTKGYVTEPGGIADSYKGTVNCYTFDYD